VAPSLSLTAPGIAHNGSSGPYLPSVRSKSNMSSNDGRHGPMGPFQTAPSRHVNDIDEFGAYGGHGKRNGGAVTMDEIGWKPRPTGSSNRANDRIRDDISTPASGSVTKSSMVSQPRFTVSNPEPDLVESQERRVQPQASQNRSMSTSAKPAPTEVPRGQWISAEDEKKRLFEDARAKVEDTQRLMASVDSDSTPAVKHFIIDR
jgi:hypothetical protein